MNNTCPRCGSDKIIPDLSLNVDYYADGGFGRATADVDVGRSPTGQRSQASVNGHLSVRVCGECGRAELQANNFRELYEKYQQSRQSQT